MSDYMKLVILREAQDDWRVREDLVAYGCTVVKDVYIPWDADPYFVNGKVIVPNITDEETIRRLDRIAEALIQCGRSLDHYLESSHGVMLIFVTHIYKNLEEHKAPLAVRLLSPIRLMREAAQKEMNK